MEKQKFVITEKHVSEIELIKKEHLTKHYGFVAILDALGTKNSNYDEIFDFLQNHFFILDLIKEIEPLFNKITNISNYKPEYYAFQDTVIVTLEIYDESNLNILLNYFGTILQYYISISFINHIMFRGSFSFGDYYKYIDKSSGDKFYFGEAINDAASWYEQANFIGIISTPKFSNYINSLSHNLESNNTLNFDIKSFREIFLSSIVSTKRGNLNCWTINWPIALTRQSTRPEDNINPDFSGIEVYYSLIKNKSVPIGAENKYMNTNNYVESIFKKFPQYLNYFRPEEKHYQELKSDPKK